MRNKKGFTLVELLAVIAILAILVIIALPNVMMMFNNAKKRAFETEVMEIYVTAKQQWISDSLSLSSDQTYAKCKSEICSKQLNLNARNNLEYYVEMNKAGEITILYVTDGTYQYKYEGNGLEKNNIGEAEIIAELKDDSERILITCGGKTEAPINRIVVAANPCNFEGELVQGKEYTNGQYTYKYKQEYNGTEWKNNSLDGWGVVLTDKNSTSSVSTKLCTSINSKPIVSMQFMFKDSKSNNIDVTSFDTSKVVSMMGMFSGAENITSIDLRSFDTSNVTNMNYMFQNNKSLTSVNMSLFDTSKVTQATGMFINNTSLENVNMDNWNLSKFNSAGSGGGMFQNTPKLKNISAKKWVLPNTFEHWISRNWAASNSPIESIDVTGWNLNNTTNIQGLFADSKSLKEIIGLNSWDTSNITNMNQLFFRCSNLNKIDLSSFDMSKVTNVGQLLMDDNNLVEFITPKEYFKTNMVIALPVVLQDNNHNYYVELNNTSVKKTKLSVSTDLVAILETGERVNGKLKVISGQTGASSNTVNSNIKEIQINTKRPNMDSMNELNVISANNSPQKIYAWFENGIIYIYSNANKISLNENSSYLFYNFNTLEKIDLSKINTSKAKNMNYMFYYTGRNASSIDLDLSSFDLTSLKSIDYIFYGLGYEAGNIRLNGLSTWNVSNIESMNSAFGSLGYNAQNINLEVKNWNINSKVSLDHLFGWFGEHAKSVNVDLSGWNLSKQKSTKSMFYDFADVCRDVKLNVSNWNTHGVEDMSLMFDHAMYYSEKLDLDFSTWDVSTVKNMSSMFQNMNNTGKYSLKLNFTGWNTSNVTNMSNMFYMVGSYVGENNYAGSEVIYNGLEGWNVSNVTNMSQMFSSSGKYAEKFVLGNLSNWRFNDNVDLSNFMTQAGYKANNVNDLGTINIYTSKISNIFSSSSGVKAVVNIHKPVTSFSNAFYYSSTISGSLITVNYKDSVTNIDQIIATKASSSNVVKGSILR